MSKHTPGPWIIQSDSCHYDTLSIVNVGRKMVVHVGGCCEPAEQEANAHLIAAAPELLRAAKDFVEWFECGRVGDKPIAELHYARAAVAKAKGEI